MAVLKQFIQAGPAGPQSPMRQLVVKLSSDLSGSLFVVEFYLEVAGDA